MHIEEMVKFYRSFITLLVQNRNRVLVPLLDQRLNLAHAYIWNCSVEAWGVGHLLGVYVCFFLCKKLNYKSAERIKQTLK